MRRYVDGAAAFTVGTSVAGREGPPATIMPATALAALRSATGRNLAAAAGQSTRLASLGRDLSVR
jgi:hypothetical protein